MAVGTGTWATWQCHARKIPALIWSHWSSEVSVRSPRRLLASCAFLTSALDVESKGTKNIVMVVSDALSTSMWVSTRLEHLHNELTAKLLENCWKKLSCKVIQDPGLVRCCMGHLWFSSVLMVIYLPKAWAPSQVVSLGTAPAAAISLWKCLSCSVGQERIYTRSLGKMPNFCFWESVLSWSPTLDFCYGFPCNVAVIIPMLFGSSQPNIKPGNSITLFVDRVDLSFSNLRMRPRSS